MLCTLQQGNKIWNRCNVVTRFGISFTYRMCIKPTETDDVCCRRKTTNQTFFIKLCNIKKRVCLGESGAG